MELEARDEISFHKAKHGEEGGDGLKLKCLTALDSCSKAETSKWQDCTKASIIENQE
jgi:hypothetical protein